MPSTRSSHSRWCTAPSPAYPGPVLSFCCSTPHALTMLLRSLSSHSGGGEHCIDRWFINQMCRKKPLLLKQRTLLILHCTARAVQTTYYYGFPIVHKTVLVYTSS